MSDSNEVRQKFIDRIKENLKNVTYPQSFDSIPYEETNCMAYAVGLKEPDYSRGRYYPGGIIHQYSYISRKTLVERLTQDLQLIGINCKVISEEEARTCKEPGKQIVAIYYLNVEENDFHMIRKDADGGWSHKISYRKAPERIDFNYERVLKKNNRSYELVAYLSLSFA